MAKQLLFTDPEYSMPNAEKFNIIESQRCTASSMFGRPSGLIFVTEKFAICKKCGEAHYINEQSRMQVNGHQVDECINCAYRERGAILW